MEQEIRISARSLPSELAATEESLDAELYQWVLSPATRLDLRREQQFQFFARKPRIF